MSTELSITLIVVLLALGALLAIRAGIRSLQSARKVAFFRTRRAHVLAGWQWLTLALVLSSFSAASAMFGEPVANRLFPPPTSTPSPSQTATNTPLPSATPFPSATLTNTSTATLTPDGTLTPTPTFTQTASQTPSQTSTPTSSATPSQTFTASPTATPTASRTPVPTSTSIPTRTPRPTWTPSPTRTLRPTLTFTVTATPTLTYTASITPSFTLTPTITQTPTPTRTPIPTSTSRPTNTQRPTSTRQPTNTSTFTATITNTPTNTSSPTLTFTPSLTHTVTSTPLPTRTSTSTATMTQTSSRTPSLTSTSTATATPSQTFTPTPSITSTLTFTATITAAPTSTSTVRPTATRQPTTTNTSTLTATITDPPSPTLTPGMTSTTTFTPSLTDTPARITTVTPSRTRTPTPTPNTGCDRIELVANLTVPDNAVFSPGSSFTKIWRLRNSGTCTWKSSYRVVFVSGNAMGGQNLMPLPEEVAPGETIDLAMNFTAPRMPGSYRGNWQIRNDRGELFGITSTANRPFWVSIRVRAPASTGPRYDFVVNACSARWFSGASNLPCPGNNNDKTGFILPQNDTRLEDGKLDTRSSLLIAPQEIFNGYIRGVYPSYKVQDGDHFQAVISCEHQAESCDVLFRLDYVVNGVVRNLWGFDERYDGSYFNVDLDLSALAGQDVRFVLLVLSNGTASGDRALWVEPRIVRSNPP